MPTSDNQESLSTGKPSTLQEHLNAGNFLTAFSEAMDRVTNLEVVTVIEEPNSTNLRDTKDGTKASQIGDPGKVLYTKISLVDGDIVNVYGREFINESESSHQSLIQFHKEQVQKGETIIQNNIDTLIKIIKYAMTLKDKDKG